MLFVCLFLMLSHSLSLMLSHTYIITLAQVRNFLVLLGAQPTLLQKSYQVITRRKLTSGVLVSFSMPYWLGFFLSRVIRGKLSLKPSKQLNLIFIVSCGSLCRILHEISSVRCLPVMSPEGLLLMKY